MLFYLGGTFIIGLLVPSDSPALDLSATDTAAGSPFVIAIQTAGIKGLPSVINAVLLTAAWSAGSSNLYTASRAIYGLALSGNAPKVFVHTLKNGLPLIAIVFCTLFAFLAYMGVNDGSGKVFNWFVNMTAVSGLMAWFGIAVTYIRFHKGLKAQGIDRSALPYASRFAPFAAWYAAISCLVVCFVSLAFFLPSSAFCVLMHHSGMQFSGVNVFYRGEWNTATFVTNYLPFVLFPILYVPARIYFKCKPIHPLEMDFISGIKEIEGYADEQPPPHQNILLRFWAWLVCHSSFLRVIANKINRCDLTHVCLQIRGQSLFHIVRKINLL